MTTAPGPVPLGTASPEAVFDALDLAVRRRLPGRLHGDKRGLRLGPGSDPEEVVRYRPGEDDVRRIDWNVTARSGEAHVWRPVAEHELEAWVLVDDTASMAFGTVHLEKRQVADGVTAAVALLTQGPGNRLGTAHLAADGLTWAQPLPSRAAAHRALRRHRATAAVGSGGSVDVGLARAVRTFATRHPRPGVRVVVTDFVEPDGRMERPFAWETPLRRLAAVHETLVVEVVDPRELELPDVGAVTLEDPETGRRREIFTSDRRLRARYAAATAAHRAATADAVRAARAGHVLLRTDRDWVRDLARFVNGRPMRRVTA
ncbi:DUF58 domain-containing protein [Nocardioides dongxiaopingii]|uniref:DUF58 domain-containing protein n=1 Tax=Nocardioides sp. S-1144 TaxID=2582905 RepID=UPI001C9E3BBD|nr:DUF58 domain-containing protein [Nocardioides sp. S-1144]